MVGTKLLQVMQETSKNVVTSGTEMLFGEVTSTSPLRIKVDNRFEISGSFIMLTSFVSDFDVETITDNVVTNVTMRLGLKVKEKVILLRVQGGQKFIVIDRVR